jgi:hypothetical protein
LLCIALAFTPLLSIACGDTKEAPAACLQRLARAKVDPDWRGLADDPEFKAVTATSPAPRAMTEVAA